MEEKITYEQAKEAKNILIKYLEERYEGYDGRDTFYRYNTEYSVLLVLKREYFLD